MTKLPMTYHDNIDGHEEWPVGHFAYNAYGDCMMIKMSETSMCMLPLVKGEKTDKAWGWDGNIERPTLKPSVLHQPPASMPWHGFVIQGELVTS